MDSNRDVLVVEDDADLNTIVGAYAQLAGLGYRSALDGGSALRQAAQKRPALILLDLMLPDIDGFEVCRRLKEDARTADVPVVMLTALKEEESRGRACGAVEYMSKPFDPDLLIAAIRRHAV
ncbi:MAG TPA: response regulator [Tepidisphaeraceae bacterium]|nr:response regulator [Tepidisphaeraceae bacterium]